MAKRELSELEKSLKVRVKAQEIVFEADVYRLSVLGMELVVSSEESIRKVHVGAEVQVSLYIKGEHFVDLPGVALAKKAMATPDGHEAFVIVLKMGHGHSKSQRDGVNTRRSKRIRLKHALPLTCTARHPMFPNEEVKFWVVDISGFGARLMTTNPVHPLFPHLTFQARFEFPDATCFDVTFRLRQVLVGELESYMLGAEFISPSPLFISEVGRFLLHTMSDLSIDDVRAAHIDILPMTLPPKDKPDADDEAGGGKDGAAGGYAITSIRSLSDWQAVLGLRMEVLKASGGIQPNAQDMRLAMNVSDVFAMHIMAVTADGSLGGSAALTLNSAKNKTGMIHRVVSIPQRVL